MVLKKYALQNAARTGHAVRFTSVSVVAMVMAAASLTARAESLDPECNRESDIAFVAPLLDEWLIAANDTDPAAARAEAQRAIADAARATRDAVRAASDAAKAAAASVDVNEIRETVRRAMDESGRRGFAFHMSDDAPQRGNPYSARELREFKQTLGDGTVISRQSTRVLARDSEGRTRQELRQPDGTARIFINDPVAKEAIIIDPQNRTACKASFNREAIYDCFSKMRGDWKPLGFAFNASSKGGIGMMSSSDDVQVNVNANAKIIDLTDGETISGKSGIFSYSASGPGTVSVSPGSVRLESPQPPQPPVPPSPPAVNASKSKEGSVKRERERVTQTYEGLRVDVDRSVETITAGAIGNSRPIESISERYYSPDLKMNVFTRRSDPRSGESTYRMVDIKRSEPEISQFRVPSGFRETQGKR